MLFPSGALFFAQERERTVPSFDDRHSTPFTGVIQQELDVFILLEQWLFFASSRAAPRGIELKLTKKIEDESWRFLCDVICSSPTDD
jgi:hypothetical protein